MRPPRVACVANSVETYKAAILILSNTWGGKNGVILTEPTSQRQTGQFEAGLYEYDPDIIFTSKSPPKHVKKIIKESPFIHSPLLDTNTALKYADLKLEIQIFRNKELLMPHALHYMRTGTTVGTYIRSPKNLSTIAANGLPGLQIRDWLREHSGFTELLTPNSLADTATTCSVLASTTTPIDLTLAHTSVHMQMEFHAPNLYDNSEWGGEDFYIYLFRESDINVLSSYWNNSRGPRTRNKILLPREPTLESIDIICDLVSKTQAERIWFVWSSTRAISEQLLNRVNEAFAKHEIKKEVRIFYRDYWWRILPIFTKTGDRIRTRIRPNDKSLTTVPLDFPDAVTQEKHIVGYDATLRRRSTGESISRPRTLESALLTSYDSQILQRFPDWTKEDFIRMVDLPLHRHTKSGISGYSNRKLHRVIGNPTSVFADPTLKCPIVREGCPS